MIRVIPPVRSLLKQVYHDEPMGGGLAFPNLRADFSPVHPRARRDVPVAMAKAVQSFLPLIKGVAKAALDCAHRTSTF
jgi:hypothetical protein